MACVNYDCCVEIHCARTGHTGVSSRAPAPEHAGVSSRAPAPEHAGVSSRGQAPALECSWTRSCSMCGAGKNLHFAPVEHWFMCTCQRDSVRMVDGNHVTYAYTHKRSSPVPSTVSRVVTAHLSTPRSVDSRMGTPQVVESHIDSPRLIDSLRKAQSEESSRARLITTLIEKAKHDAAKQRRRILLRYTDASQHVRSGVVPCGVSASHVVCNSRTSGGGACSPAFPKLATHKSMAIAKTKFPPKLHSAHVPRPLCPIKKPKLSFVHTRLT